MRLLINEDVLKTFTLTGRMINGAQKPNTESFDVQTPKILMGMQGAMLNFYFNCSRKFFSASARQFYVRKKLQSFVVTANKPKIVWLFLKEKSRHSMKCDTFLLIKHWSEILSSEVLAEVYPRLTLGMARREVIIIVFKFVNLLAN